MNSREHSRQHDAEPILATKIPVSLFKPDGKVRLDRISPIAEGAEDSEEGDKYLEGHLESSICVGNPVVLSFHMPEIYHAPHDDEHTICHDFRQQTSRVERIELYRGTGNVIIHTRNSVWLLQMPDVQEPTLSDIVKSAQDAMNHVLHRR